MFQSNVSLTPRSRLAVHRRIALGTWSAPDDPTVHGTLKLPADPMLDYLAALRVHSGQRVTITTAVARAMAVVLREVPDANAIIRWGRLYLRDDIDIFVHVSLMDEKTGKPDLSGVTLRHVDRRDMVDLARELDASVAKVRERRDASMVRTRNQMRQMPQALVRGALRLLAFLSYTLNIDASLFGAPRDPFGGLAITNVGSLGLDTAYVPLVPYTRLPVFLAVGAVTREPVVVQDADGSERIEIASVLPLHAAFDHRVLDGSHVAQMANILRRVFADPVAAFGRPDA